MTHLNSSDTTPSLEFALRRTYALTSSEVIGVPEVFEISEPPQLDIKLNIESRATTSSIGNYVVELTVVVTATHDEKTVFLIEVKQGGIFTINGFDETNLAKIMNIHCPSVLYPYASALVSDLVLRSGFMPLYLPPVDFNAMYEQQKVREKPQSTNE